MHCHCGTNNRESQWTFTDPCKPEVRPGAREESASPVWLATPAMNARDTTKSIYGGLTGVVLTDTNTDGMDTLTQGTMEWLPYPLCNALREDNNDVLRCDLYIAPINSYI